MKHLLSLILLIVITPILGTSNHLYTVFSNTALRSEFKGFIQEVLRQVPTDKLYALLDECGAARIP